MDIRNETAQVITLRQEGPFTVIGTADHEELITNKELVLAYKVLDDFLKKSSKRNLRILLPQEDEKRKNTTYYYQNALVEHQIESELIYKRGNERIQSYHEIILAGYIGDVDILANTLKFKIWDLLSDDPANFTRFEYKPQKSRFYKIKENKLENFKTISELEKSLERVETQILMKRNP